MTLAADLLRAIDPVAVAQEVGMTPDPWQVHALCTPSDRLLLNLCAAGWQVHRGGSPGGSHGAPARWLHVGLRWRGGGADGFVRFERDSGQVTNIAYDGLSIFLDQGG